MYILYIFSDVFKHVYERVDPGSSTQVITMVKYSNLFQNIPTCKDVVYVKTALNWLNGLEQGILFDALHNAKV